MECHCGDGYVCENHRWHTAVVENDGPPTWLLITYFVVGFVLWAAMGFKWW